MSEAYALEYLDRGTDRLGLHIYPDPGGDASVVIIWPAMGTPARFYRPFAQKLGEAGLAVVAVDLRGTGSSTPVPSRSSRYGYGDIASDVGAVLDALKSRLDGRRRYLLGHSLGGQACAIHLARSGGSDVDGLILVAVGLPWYRSYRGARRRGVLLFTQWIVAVTATLRVWPGWGFGGRQARGVIRDWGYTARHGRFPRLNGAAVDLSAVRTPVLAISVSKDRFTPAATLDHLCGLLSSAPIERVHLKDTLDHFTWVRSPEAVATRVVEFVS
jgi:predicted alpha/beta hydrolase